MKQSVRGITEAVKQAVPHSENHLLFVIRTACSGGRMKFQPGNKLGRKFQPGQSGNPAGRPPKWKRLARAIDAADDPFVPRGSILMAAGASYADVLRYDAERDTQPRRRAPSPDELGKALNALDRIKRKRAAANRRTGA